MVPIGTQGGQAQIQLRQLRLQADIAALGLDGGDLLLLLFRGQAGVILDGGNADVIGRLFRLQLRLALQDGLQLVQLLLQLSLPGIHLAQAVPHSLQGLGGRLGHGPRLRRADGGLGVQQLTAGLLQLGLGGIQLSVYRGGQLFGQGVQLLLAEDHVHLLLQNAADGHAGHTCDALHLTRQGLFHELRQLRHIHTLPGHGGDLHRQHGGVDLQHIGRAHGIIPAALEGGDLLLDVHACGVHVHPLLKLQHHHGHAVLAGGGDVLDLVQRSHGLLQGLGDVRLHRFRAGTHIGGHDDHIGEIHVGQQVRRHLQVGYYAQHQDGQHRHKHGERLFYAEFRHPVHSFFEKH